MLIFADKETTAQKGFALCPNASKSQRKSVKDQKL